VFVMEFVASLWGWLAGFLEMQWESTKEVLFGLPVPVWQAMVFLTTFLVVLNLDGYDRIYGNGRRDRIDAGPGHDVVSSGDSFDMILVRDGTRDRVNCGADDDEVSADRFDVVSPNCETVRIK
jgi:hypothetical protein